MFKKVKQLFCTHKFEVLNVDAYEHLNLWGDTSAYKIHYTACCEKCNKYITDEIEFSPRGVTLAKAEELVKKHLNR